MINYRSEITIERPVNEVFRFLTDAANYPLWTDMTESRLVSGGPPGIGYCLR